MSAGNSAPTKVEQKIDAALRILAEVQAPQTMAARIHRNLEVAATSSQPFRSRWPFWVPATYAAVGTILFAVLLPTHIIRRQQTSAYETPKMAATSSVSPQVATSRSTPAPARISPAHESSGTPANPRTLFRESHSRPRGEYRHAANLFNYPVTRQERLFVQFVQTAKPADLQTLNPEYQAKLEAQQDAEFAAYLQSGSSGTDNETSLQE